MNRIKAAFLLALIFIIAFGAKAQIIADPTTWKYEVKKKGNNEYDLIFRLSLKEHWHIYSQKPGGDGMQIPPTFTFSSNAAISKVGGVKEKGKKVTEVMQGIDGEKTTEDL